MPIGPKPPSAEQIGELAWRLDLDLTDEEIEAYARIVGAGMAAYRRLDELAAPKPPVRYPRSPGYRPAPEDNPCNGWYWRTDIRGAETGPLAGERVAVKDVICVAGVPMMAGLQILEGFVPDIDATVVTRLLDAGAVIVGKAHAEDPGGSQTCALGPVRNPYKPTHVPGTSSAGSAVVLATGQVDMALGGDQGGSIRIPASWTGVYGLKPTYGLVPYTGCMMIETTLDHVGPMANSTEAVARMLSVLAGPDPLDPRQRGVIPPDYVQDYTPALERGVAGLKIAVVREGFDQQPWKDLGLPASEAVVDDKVRAALRRLESLGAEVAEVSIPMHLVGPYIFRGIITEGCAQFMFEENGGGTNWSGFHDNTLIEALARGRRARPHALPPGVVAVALTGEYLQRYYDGRYYAKAQNLRPNLVAAYDDVLRDHDLIAMPTIPFRAPPIPAEDSSIEERLAATGAMYANTCQADVTGHPAMSIPCGMADGLPIGLMLTGRHFDDATVIAASQALEASGDWKAM